MSDPKEPVSAEGFVIEVRGPHGPVEKLAVHCARVLVGSGAHCDVRLPVEHAAVEHVELTAVEGRLHARARAFDPAPTLGGAPFVQSYVEPGVWIGIGPYQILATPVAEEATSADRRRGTARRPFVAIVAVAATLLLAAGFSRRGTGADGRTPAEPPPLWTGPVTSCPQTGTGSALAFARERATLAEGKRERRPFQVRDGVVAVSLFEVASACYVAAGEAERAAATSRDAGELRARVQADYHAHQVRLEHAIFVGDRPTAAHEVKVLRAFTEGSSGPYAAWLSDMDRRLQLELAKEHTS